MKVACIGAGNMGGAVARNLALGDFAVKVYDPDPAAVARCVAAGAEAADRVEDAVADVEVVLTSLPTTRLVGDTVALLAGAAGPGVVVVDISTVDPATAREASDRCAAAGLTFVACPLGKTPTHAERGEIPLFVGGPIETVERLEPLFTRMGEKTYYFGTIEAATTFKLVSNLIGMANVAVLAEGYALAQRAGIDPDTFSTALKDTGAASFQEEVRLPWMVRSDWTPRFGVDLALKDVRLAVGAARTWGIDTPVAVASMERLGQASAQGFGAEDVVAVLKLCGPQGTAAAPETRP